jgi:hypothetical protein
MKIFITGGTGFVGTLLCKQMVEKGNDVTAVSRSGRGEVSGVQYLKADTRVPGPWQDELADQDVVINLAGVSIFSRWSKSKKEAIYSSRIETTRNISDVLTTGAGKNIHLISASAAGYYGFHGDEAITESDPPGDDFLARVCVDWEKEALRSEEGGARVTLARFGIILGPGGALDILVPLFRFFLGSRLGNGRQFFPWIHHEDLLAIIRYIMEQGISGPVNCTAPEPVTNREMTRILARVLHRPVLVPFVPAFAMKLVMGEFGSMLLEGQRALPRVLLDRGFEFRFSDFEEALRHFVESESS